MLGCQGNRARLLGNAAWPRPLVHFLLNRVLGWIVLHCGSLNGSLVGEVGFILAFRRILAL